jgi:hypothetical protein
LLELEFPGGFHGFFEGEVERLFFDFLGLEPFTGLVFGRTGAVLGPFSKLETIGFLSRFGFAITSRMLV